MRRTIGPWLALAALLAAGPAAAQTCGNFAREGPEQCDDGNLRNLDGCDAGCRFEHTQRVNDLQMQFATAAECTVNRLGAAIRPAAQNQVQTSISTAITDGSTSALFHVLGLDDPAGVDDPALEVGVLAGLPVQPGSAPYNGNTSADWWYAVGAADLDGDRLPLDRLAGGVAGSAVAVGPGPARLRLSLGGAAAELAFSSLRVAMTTGAVSTPPASSGLAPGREAIEHLDPALQTFASASQGTLCGNISASTLDQIPIPAALLSGTFVCGQGYTGGNSFLDLVVGGCTVLGVVPAVAASQPDQSDPDAPVMGAGGPYTLVADPVTRAVTTCRDQAAAIVDLNGCLNAAAYSGFFRFTTHRVLAADDLVFDDGFESGTLAAWSASSTDGGDLAVSADAAIVGGFGLRGTVNDTTGLFVQDDEPEDESRFRGRFHFDPSGFDPGEANGRFRTRILIAFEENPTRRVMAVVLRRQAGAYSVMVRARQDDNSQVNTAFFPITAEPHRLDFEWIRSSGPSANDGVLRVLLDGALAQTLTGLDNSISSIDFTRLGALSVKAGASGTLDWDAYQARRRAPAVP